LYIYTIYGRIFGDFPVKNTVHKPYLYGSGQPYVCTVFLAGKSPNNTRSYTVYIPVYTRPPNGIQKHTHTYTVTFMVPLTSYVHANTHMYTYKHTQNMHAYLAVHAAGHQRGVADELCSAHVLLTCTQTHTHTHTRIHTHTYTHTRIHTRMPTLPFHAAGHQRGVADELCSAHVLFSCTQTHAHARARWRIHTHACLPCRPCCWSPAWCR